MRVAHANPAPHCSIPWRGVNKNRTMLDFFLFLEAENLIDIDYMDKEPLVESLCVYTRCRIKREKRYKGRLN